MAGLRDDPDLGAVWDALPGARVVGGAVRDTLAGRPIADVDLATPLPPEAVARALGAAGLRALPTGLDHGTITALSGGRGFEITTLRRDVETDGRHARVAFTDDWQADAARRDFTINAMSMTRDGALHDYFGGADDLAARRVRFVGDPATRIAEDFLRVLRFFRFQARYGGPPPDATTRAALAGAVPGLARLSPERVWSEIKQILAAPDPDAALALMAELGVLAAVLPDIATPPARLANLPPDPVLRLAALAPGDSDALAGRLRLSTAEQDRLRALLGPPLAEDVGPDDLRRALADTPGDILADRARIAGHPDLVTARLLATPRPTFPIQGRDLVAEGVPPGPGLGALLRDLRACWMASGCMLDAAALRGELARRLGR